MTIALADAIVAEGSWVKETVLGNYILWANSGTRFIGRNTRSLLGKIKPGKRQRMINTYTVRWLCDHERFLDAWPQSNGCLMRASPLAVLDDPAAVADDCALTNAHPVCLEACRFYHAWLRGVLKGLEPLGAAQAALAYLEARPMDGVAPELLALIGRESDFNDYDDYEYGGADPALIAAGRQFGGKATVRVAEVVKEALAGRVVDGEKGWIPTSLSRALALFAGGVRPQGAMLRDCVRWGGDTDTNAAIAGAVVGAAVGEAALTTPLLQTVLACDTAGGDLARPPQYRSRSPHRAGGPPGRALRVGRGVAPFATPLALR